MIDEPAGAPAFESWLEDFFAYYSRRRPVNATFIGRHEYDHCLPDLSLEGIEQTRNETSGLLDRLRELPDEPLDSTQTLDRRLAEGFLEIALWECGSPHFSHGNPSIYTGEAIFGVVSLFLRPFAPFANRAERAVSRLEAIPPLLEAGKRTLTRAAPLEWTERAIRECTGAVALFTRGIDLLLGEEEGDYESVRASARSAAAAFADFQGWLRSSLAANPGDAYACGTEALELLLSRGHFLATGASEIERAARNQIRETEAYLREHASDFGARSTQEALARLADHHPSVDGYYSRYADLWAASRALATELNLLTWPDYPIAFRPQPAWVREAAPYLYFLFYRAPATFDYPLPMEYLVTPVEAGMPEPEQDSRLRSTNDSVIKLNHVVHHGGIGHHIQNWHAIRAPSRIGQVAAVDCASRIAMFCGGTMAEGWACYATELMDEAGFLTPLESYAEAHARLRMAARAVADVRLHSGEWTPANAAAYYRERVGMPDAAAQAEAVKNSMFPGTALMYLTGTDLIHDLRRKIARREGSSFNLARFHDTFLSHGSVPVTLVAERMLEGADAE